MKLTPLCKTLPPLAALLFAPLLHAVININTVPVPDAFTAPPWPTTNGDATATGVTGEWTTLRVGTATDLSVPTPPTFDAKIIAGASAATIITALGSSGTFSATTGPSTNSWARYNNGTSTVPAGITFIQTRPTGEEHLLLLAHLSNATGTALNAVRIAYDYSKFTELPGAATETIKGLRAFWSVTGTAGSWSMIPELSVDTTGVVATPQAVSATITLPAPLANGGTMFILWADENSSGTDSSYHIDNFAASSGVVPACSITGTTTSSARTPGPLPGDPSDDSVSFTANITGTGILGPAGWRITYPPALAGQTGTYGTDVPLTAPASLFTNGILQINVVDSVEPACSTAVYAATSSLIGTNTAGNRAILSAAPVPLQWTVIDSTRTATQTDATQGDQIIDSEVIDLSSLGNIKFTAALDAITGTSSGFEALDSFALELIIDGGAPVSALGAADTNSDGRLTGAAGAGTELPGATVLSTTKAFTFTSYIPDTANTLQIRIIGNSNSASETYRVKNVLLETAANTLLATVAGPVTRDNKGTVDPSDDEFSGPVNITQVGLAPPSTGWHSDESPQRTGLYATANPVTFGPYLVSGGAKTVILTDDVEAVSSQPLVFTPPVPALTVSAATNIRRNDNAPGIADDTVSFDVTVTGTNGGPSWTAGGATPAAGAFGSVTFTVPAGTGVTSATVTVADASYASATQTVTATFATPGGYIIGQINLGGGPVDLLSLPVAPPNTEWVNDPVARTITMTDGNAPVAGVKVITSEPVILSAAARAVQFTATLTTRDTSGGFEVGDTFVAELILDDGVNPATTVNVILPFDADGSLLLEDDELSDGMGTAANPNIRNILLSAIIPDNITQATLVIRGVNDSANETMIVSNVLFALAPLTNDTDGDGVSDINEEIMGTSPNDPGDVLRLSQSAGNPLQIGFPTKAGRFYRVYVSDDTDGQEISHLAIWKDAVPLGLATGTISGDGNPASFSITVTPGERRRFYRLHVMTTNGTTGAGDWPATAP